MQVMNIPIQAGRPPRRWLLVGCLAVLLALSLPTTALAGSADPGFVGPDTCAQCHATEAAVWGDSPHGHVQSASIESGVTCEACHGAYVPNHPQSGMMQLPVDGSCCQTCHTSTYEEWHETGHAGANVQCTSCHVPHSQETRLSAEELCESCHREESEHWVHHEVGVHCTDCHLVQSTASETAGGVQALSTGVAPDHRFGLAVETCVDCHAESIHDNAYAFHEAVGQMEQSQLSEMTERARELAYQLENAKESSQSLRTMSVVSLGFGLGTGGVLGVIFMLVVGYITQGRARR